MTYAQAGRTMTARAAALHNRTADAVQQAGEEAYAAGIEVMEEKIYGHPIPQTKSGKPKWRHTRDLIKGEKLQVDRQALTAKLVNDVVYARARHELKAGQTPWPAHWRDEAVARAREQFSGRVARAVESV